MNVLTTWDLLKLCGRLVFIQSAWSAGSMQSEGFVYCISPALQKLFPDPEKRRRILKHYQMPINTHPFLAGVLAGAMLKLESEDKPTKSIVTHLRSTMGPLAAMGDPFFHAGLAPLATVLAAIIGLLFGSMAGIIAILVIFNSVHLAFRFSGVFVGYRHGDTALTAIGQWITPAKTWLARTVTAVLSGVLLGIIGIRFGGAFDLSLSSIIAGALTIALAMLLNKRRSSWVFIMPAFLLAVLVLEVIVQS